MDREGYKQTLAENLMEQWDAEARVRKHQQLSMICGQFDARGGHEEIARYQAHARQKA